MKEPQTDEERAEMVAKCRYNLSQAIMLKLMDERDMTPNIRADIAVNQADWLLYGLGLAERPS